VPFNLSTGELLVLLVVAVVVFGGRLPNVARKVGSAISEFKRGMRDEVRRMEDDFTPPAPPPGWSPPEDRESRKDPDGK
jgi:sec-independent protein translocase protein TatA